MPTKATTPKPPKPLRRAAVRRLLKAKPAMSAAERACAALLADGIGEDGVAALASITPAQQRDLLGSIRVRVDNNERLIFRDRRKRTEAASKRSEPVTDPEAGRSPETREG